MQNTTQRLIALFKRHPECFVNIISCSFPLRFEQIKKYENKLLWNDNVSGFFVYGLSSNENLKWTDELVYDFKNNWDWTAISSFIFGIFWYDGILDKYIDKINWKSISWNTKIPWSADLIHKYSHKLDWDTLSQNTSIPWDEELIRKYEGKINFEYLSNNLSTPWSEKNIYTHTVTKNTLPLEKSLYLIERYENKLNWDELFFDWTNGLDRDTMDEIIDKVLDFEE